MIQYIGNYKSLIHESWVKKMKITTGEIRPNKNMIMTDFVYSQQKQWIDAGYNATELGSATWELFHDWDFDERLDIEKFDFCKNKKHQWWISKIRPGRCFPMHVDTIKTSMINPQRYWVAMEDYKWGHIFIVGNEILRDYKKGDVFLFDNIEHGAANVGLEIKFSLQILVWEELN
jgi:hypothetical protein